MNDSNDVLVSIIVASYNHEYYIKDSIQSVIDQTYQNWELIIIDDGSVDNTQDVVRSFLSDERIKFSIQENHGVSYTTNRGIEKSIGDAICFLDSDDMWLSTKLEKQVKKYKQGCDVIATKVQVFDNNKNLNPKWCERGFNANDDAIFDKENILKYFVVRNYFCKSSMMIDKELFNKVGLFDERYINVYDYKLWMEFLQHAKCVYRCDEKLTRYRWHNDSATLKSEYRTNLEFVLIFLENAKILLNLGVIDYDDYIARAEKLFEYKKFYRTVSFVALFEGALVDSDKVTDLIENVELIEIVKKHDKYDGINDPIEHIQEMENSVFWKMRNKYMSIKSIFYR